MSELDIARNAVIAAACAVTDCAVKDWDVVHDRLDAAVARYRAARTPGDAARDAFLAEYPTAEALQSAVDAATRRTGQ